MVELERLESQLQALIDEKQIVAVSVRYANALDAHDWQGLSSCFTPDALANYHVDGGEDLRGAEQITAFLRAGDEPLTATQHYVGNHAVSIDGDRARSTCYVLAQHVRRGAPGGSKWTIGGIYRDELVRTENGWQIRHRDVQGVWASGNPRVSFPGE